jgi:hypothetical protein
MSVFNLSVALPGDRVLIVAKAKWLNGSSATVQTQQRRPKPVNECMLLTIDRGRNGAGEPMCLPLEGNGRTKVVERLVPLPKLTLRQALSGSADVAMIHRSRRASSRLVLVAADSPEAWKRGLRLPSYTIGTAAPPQRLATVAPAAAGMRSPILPSLFVPGFPKSATTWLYTCIAEAFTPRRVGCGADASGWNASACGRRFLLTPLTAERWQHGEFVLESKKETFFFGGARQRRFRDDLLTLSGPDPARGAMMGEPALWAWEHKAQRVMRLGRQARPHLPTTRYNGEFARAAQQGLMTRIARSCSRSQPPCAGGSGKRRERRRQQQQRRRQSAAAAAATASNASSSAASATGHGQPSAHGDGTVQAVAALNPPIDDCTHVACHRVVRGVPSTHSGACSWNEDRSHAWLGRNDSYCFHSMLPYAESGAEYNLLVSDFTPNYLCDAEALPRLKASLPEPDALRFIVVMREPTSRAFSEWAMFALQWTWDPVRDFGATFAQRVQQLRLCNETLFRNPSVLKSLPTAELSSYLGRCWNFGGAMMYATNSLYAVCVLHALRFFRREQFLFLRYEDLMSMSAEAVLKLVGRFTGLYAGGDLIKSNQQHNRCHPGARKGGRAAHTYDTISPEERVLYNHSAAFVRANRLYFDELFRPYNALLTELIGHPDFSWAPRSTPRSHTGA